MQFSQGDGSDDDLPDIIPSAIYSSKPSQFQSSFTHSGTYSSQVRERLKVDFSSDSSDMEEVKTKISSHKDDHADSIVVSDTSDNELIPISERLGLMKASLTKDTDSNLTKSSADSVCISSDDEEKSHHKVKKHKITQNPKQLQKQKSIRSDFISDGSEDDLPDIPVPTSLPWQLDLPQGDDMVNKHVSPTAIGKKRKQVDTVSSLL